MPEGYIRKEANGQVMWFLASDKAAAEKWMRDRIPKEAQGRSRK